MAKINKASNMKESTVIGKLYIHVLQDSYYAKSYSLQEDLFSHIMTCQALVQFIVW